MYTFLMLYVFHGPDIESGLKKARTLIDSLRTKRPDAAFETIDAEHWNSSILEGHLGGQGLFSNKYIVFLNRVTENAEAKEQLADFAQVMNESENIFIVLEGKILADLKKKFEKYAEKVVENVYRAIAQLVEQLPFKEWVVGSTPTGRTNFKNATLAVGLLFGHGRVSLNTICSLSDRGLALLFKVSTCPLAGFRSSFRHYQKETYEISSSRKPLCGQP
jgi:hypothetical protein